MKRRAFLVGLAGLSTVPVGAQPSQASRPSVANLPVRTHTFQVFRFASVDGQRHYRIEVAVPCKAPPKSGYPSLWLCDGNAALMALTPLDLEAAPDLVLVSLGYDIEGRFDLLARNYDYTPAVNGEATVDEMRPENRAGGAEVFTRFLMDRVWPTVKQIGLDPNRRGLWGHSYGGLFTLATLFTHPELFKVYAAASPSLWWYQGKPFAGSPVAMSAKRDVLLMTGDAEVNRRVIHGRTLPSPEDTVAALKTLGARLRATQNLHVETQILNGLNHGPVFEASLPITLRYMTSHL